MHVCAFEICLMNFILFFPRTQSIANKGLADKFVTNCTITERRRNQSADMTKDPKIQTQDKRKTGGGTENYAASYFHGELFSVKWHHGNKKFLWDSTTTLTAYPSR